MWHKVLDHDAYAITRDNRLNDSFKQKKKKNKG